MRRILLLFIVLLPLLALPSFGWNATGHKAIGLNAYGQLTPATRARVDQLLARHPDYPIWIAGATPASRGVVAFIEASSGLTPSHTMRASTTTTRAQPTPIN